MSTKQKAIILDCDDTILDWIGAFIEWHNNNYFTDASSAGADYNLCDVLGSMPEVLDMRAKEFNNTWAFGCLKPIGGAEVHLPQIMECYPDIKIILCTKCGTSDMTRNLRLANLYNHFGNFPEVHFLRPHDSKEQVFKNALNEYDVQLIVDDVIENVQLGLSLGINSVVFARPHNIKSAGARGLVVLHDWYDIRHRLIEPITRTLS